MPSRRAIARDVSDLGRSRRTNDRKNSDPRSTIVQMPVRKGRRKTAPQMRAHEDKNKAAEGSARKNKASTVRQRFVREDRSKDGQSLDRKDRPEKSPLTFRLVSTLHRLNLHRPIRHRNDRMRASIDHGDAEGGGSSALCGRLAKERNGKTQSSSCLLADLRESRVIPSA